MEQKRIYRPRCELHEGLMCAFASQREVRDIHVFGREVEGKVDALSDIDLIVCSDDLAGTQQGLANVLESVSPVIAKYVIHESEREMAEMVIFRDFSPYQKIDLSITDAIERKVGFGPFKCVYRRGEALSSNASVLQIRGERDTLNNRLNDVLFSIPRFTKCLFRGDRDLYRRWMGVCEQLAVLLYEKHFGVVGTWVYRLTPPQYKAMNAALTPAEAKRLERIWPVSAEPRLVEGFALAVEWIVELYQEKAAATGQWVDGAFAEYMTQWMAWEIERWDAQECLGDYSKSRERNQLPARLTSLDERR